ncbi:hypothetical protein CBM2586_A11567 [Cupriavidus phytorum]|uniref:Uncharacterized protein n=1 Tax=Cupriavidus taiwanensis TaxID=164546 RepID=A0A375BEL1_9BURK|nr:hypothetical protein CBM2586_A11567 [Cupriavidus taiwanensis]
MFSLSPHGERVGVRGGLARNHVKRGQWFYKSARSAVDPPALTPCPSPASGRGEQTCG